MPRTRRRRSPPRSPRAGGPTRSPTTPCAVRARPAGTPETHPRVVVLADGRDWRTGIAAAQFGARPLRAPILLTDGDTLPDASKAALDALQPTGAKELGGVKVVRVGTRADVGAL